MGSLSILQGIFPTQGLNPGLPHCRRILYQLSHKGSPTFLKLIEKNISQAHENIIFEDTQISSIEVKLFFDVASDFYRRTLQCAKWGLRYSVRVYQNGVRQISWHFINMEQPAPWGRVFLPLLLWPTLGCLWIFNELIPVYSPTGALGFVIFLLLIF